MYTFFLRLRECGNHLAPFLPKKKNNKKFNCWLILYDLEVTVKFLLFCLEEFQENLNLLKKGTVGTIYEFCRTEKFNPGSL